MSELMPREKALQYGIASLSNNELLALIIKSGVKGNNVNDVVNDVIKLAGGFNNLLSLSYEELITIKGINMVKALEIMTILEIYKRLTKVDKVSQDELRNPSKVAQWIRFNLAYSIQEEFLVIFLNGKGDLIKSEILYKGSKNSSIVGVDEILRKAILFKASGIIVAHNHPSDNVLPSNEDIQLTRRLSSSCKMVEIPLLDHIIVGKSDYFSFSNQGLLC